MPWKVAYPNDSQCKMVSYYSIGKNSASSGRRSVEGIVEVDSEDEKKAESKLELCGQELHVLRGDNQFLCRLNVNNWFRELQIHYH